MYSQIITALTDKEPRHVEAHLRSWWPTLDHLGERQLEREIKQAANLVDYWNHVEPSMNERIAQSFGL